MLTNESDGLHASASQEPFSPTGVETTPEDIARLLQIGGLVTRQLGLQPGQRAVLVNGRVRHLSAATPIGPHPQFHETACWTL